ncbi:MAG: M24 family metallopeptidase, partial [Agromyces sp.]
MPKDASGHLIPGRLSPLRAVPASIPRPEYVGKRAPAPSTGGDRYTPEEVELVRAAGRVAAGAIETASAAIRPGVTTDELDRIAHEYVVAHGAYPSTLGYRGFPKSSCTSVNEVICHGIPDDTVLAEGDLVNIDVTAFLDG